MKILSDPANLAAVRTAIEMLCAENGFDRPTCDEVGLCLNEALANVIRHAYRGATDRPIDIAAHFADQSLRISIRDWGSGVNPEELPEPPNARDPLLPGGLGLICLRKMMDEVHFTPQPDGMLLELVRRCRKQSVA